jgi:hypothetical protein
MPQSQIPKSDSDYLHFSKKTLSKFLDFVTQQSAEHT